MTSSVDMHNPHPFEFRSGAAPLLISMPHSGTILTQEVADGLTPDARALPDTDWHLPELYDFLDGLDVGCIQANYSRYVVDLNRPLDDRPLYAGKTTGLFPQILFDESPVFEEGMEPTDAHRLWCQQHIWQPYHEQIEAELQRLKAQFGYAILFDAHSIAAEVPMLFEGRLPDFNFGTNSGRACASEMALRAQQAVEGGAWSAVIDGRFKGGFITRQYGRPEQGIHALQLELSQAAYLRETSGYELDPGKVSDIRPALRALLQALRDYRPVS